MNIIPTINVITKEDAERVIKKLQSLPITLVQFDVSDGNFSKTISWNNPKEAVTLVSSIIPGASVEAHLMVQDQKTNACAWIDAGAKRVIVHREALDSETFDFIKEYAKNHNAHVMLALSPDTKVEEIKRFNDIEEIQLLAVHPGPSGQIFIPSIIQKIDEVREIDPKIYIEVDGGINQEIIQLIKDTGINSVAVGAFLSKSEDVAGSFQKLL